MSAQQGCGVGDGAGREGGKDLGWSVRDQIILRNIK